MALLSVIILIAFQITSCVTKYYYVTKNGTDYHDCGITLETPCGTMFYQSYPHDTYTRGNSIEFRVYGQNQQEISKYLDTANSTDGFHPCLPVPRASITIHFYVQNMQDWYPSICYNISSSFTINSPFMFLAQNQLIIYGLILSNYQFTSDQNPNSIMTIVNPDKSINGIIECNNCTFVNISAQCIAKNTMNTYILDADYTPWAINTPQIIPNSLGLISTYLYHSTSEIQPAYYYKAPNMKLINNLFTNINYFIGDCDSHDVGFITNYVEFIYKYILVHDRIISRSTV